MILCESGHKYRHFTYSRPAVHKGVGTRETYAQNALYCTRCSHTLDLYIGDPQNTEDKRPGGGAERLNDSFR